ncbi:hypothetical protein [Sphaerothrix gracilis]|uniref:hypothetical protein n=1 Tax=Sphaerothrix gracilis TaxID=3151835 RepID=UPI0031FCF866
MKAKRIEDVLNAQQSFTKQMQQQMQQFSQQVGSGIAVPDKKTQLQQFEQRLRTTTAAKAAAMRRYDDDIRRYKEAIARIKEEIKTTDKVQPRRERQDEG